MKTPKASRLLHRAAELRRVPTPAERILWNALRAHRLGSIHFRRQHVIGPYIVDFCAPRHGLVIELDGHYHLDIQEQERDHERTLFLNSQGYRVMRFLNRDVLERLDETLRLILENIRLHG